MGTNLQRMWTNYFLHSPLMAYATSFFPNLTHVFSLFFQASTCSIQLQIFTHISTHFSPLFFLVLPVLGDGLWLFFPSFSSYSYPLNLGLIPFFLLFFFLFQFFILAGFSSIFFSYSLPRTVRSGIPRFLHSFFHRLMSLCGGRVFRRSGDHPENGQTKLSHHHIDCCKLPSILDELLQPTSASHRNIQTSLL